MKPVSCAREASFRLKPASRAHETGEFLGETCL